MKILVTYQSKTGFTKKYAQWIAQALSCECKEVKSIAATDIAAYDLVIHGGWIMGGIINGLEKVRGFQPKKLVVFGVGFTKKEDVDSQKIAEANKLGDIPFFYFEGGTDPKKMGFFSRTIVKMVTKQKVVFTDLTKKEAIEELLNAIERTE